tara:strand:- start:816 stop:1205 length:390 start_codon:yes stop_codon:yes gene_type:complete
MSRLSVSKEYILLEIDSKQIIKCELKRHLSPRTVGQIIRALPLFGNAHILGKSAVYFETSIESGVERSKNVFKKGDIAFLPVRKLIYFFYSDVKVGKTMTPIGKIIGNVDKLSGVNSGSELKFYCEIGV